MDSAGEKSDKRKVYRRRRIIVVLIAVLVLVYLSYALISSAARIRQTKLELAAMELRLAQQQSINDELRRILDSGDVSAQMERIARSKLGYARPDERLYIDSRG